jgi:hypothetical protein
MIAATIAERPLPNPPPQAGEGANSPRPNKGENSSHLKTLPPSLTLPLKGGGDKFKEALEEGQPGGSTKK